MTELNTALTVQLGAVVTAIDEQSPDIAQGVNDGYENREQGGNDNENSTGAGDQGMMFGYACDETPEFMPMPISLAHKMAKKLTQVRKDGILDYLRPDGKTQVTVEYDDDKPVRVDAVVVSSQHSPDVDIQKLREDIKREVILTTVPAELIDENTKFYINPTGRFVVGGPNGDSGLTGRKLIVDTYGGYARHGGGAFSGKDPTKVDRVPHMHLVGLQRMLLRQDLQRSAKFSLHMQSALHTLFQ